MILQTVKQFFAGSKDIFIGLLVLCVGTLGALLGLSKGKERKRVRKEMNDSLTRVENERLNRLYVKKIRLDRRIDEFNRLHNIKTDKDASDSDNGT